MGVGLGPQHTLHAVHPVKGETWYGEVEWWSIDREIIMCQWASRTGNDKVIQADHNYELVGMPFIQTLGMTTPWMLI